MVHILFSDLVLKHGCSLANVEHVVVCAMSEFCHHKTTPVGFEPTRGDPIGLAGRRLNRSAKVSLVLRARGLFRAARPATSGGFGMILQHPAEWDLDVPAQSFSP